MMVFPAWNKLCDNLRCNSWSRDCFVGKSCCELFKFPIVGCYGKYFIVSNTSISICSPSSQLLVSTRFILLESFCNNLTYFCFLYNFSPSNRVWPLASSDKFSRGFHCFTFAVLSTRERCSTGTSNCLLFSIKVDMILHWASFIAWIYLPLVPKKITYPE